MSLTRSGLLANNRSSVLAEDGPYRVGSRANWLRKWSCAISSIRMHCLEIAGWCFDCERVPINGW